VAKEGLIPSLDRLRFEFNVIAPGRSKASDGWVGDAAHQAEVSDHNWDETGSVPIHDADTVNEVHAIDVDSDLRTPGLDMETVVQHILDRCRSGAETRLRYVIYNRRIWSASSGWVQKAYTGASAHTEHAHFSASYDTAKEASTASWRLEEIPVPLTAADKTWIADQIDKASTADRAWIVAQLTKTVGGLPAQIDKAATDAAARVWASKVDIDRSKTGVNLQPAGSVLAYGSGEHHDITDAAARVDQRVTALEELTRARVAELEELAQKTFDAVQALTVTPPPAS
jgi:hypothetical protein